MTAPADPGAVPPPDLSTIHSADGTALHLREWRVEAPRALVRIVHGLGEHAGRYGHVAAALGSRGIAAAAVDLRGHGKSSGRRGHVDRFEQLLDDVDALARATPTGAPVFLLGHSLGGLVALRCVQAGRAVALRGLVLSAPALGLVHSGSPFHRAGARLLRIVVPRLGLPNGIDPADISRDPATVRAYREDPAVHDRITPALYREMLAAMGAAAADAARVEIPALLLAPGDDRITRVPVAEQVAEGFLGPVEIRRYPGYFHEPFNETGRGLVIADLLEWIEQRLA